MIKGLLIKRNENNQITFKEIKLKNKDNLQDFYNYLDCQLIDIQERYINNKIYDFIFDDEGLINNQNRSSELIAVGLKNNEILESFFHALIICGQANEKGEETTLTKEDIYKIINSQIILKDTKTNQFINAIKYSFEEEQNTIN